MGAALRLVEVLRAGFELATQELRDRDEGEPLGLETVDDRRVGVHGGLVGVMGENDVAGSGVRGAGDLVDTGSGSLADPGAAPTTFEIVGTCP